MLTITRRNAPWVVLIVVHALGLTVTATLFVVAALTEAGGGAAAHQAAAAWTMTGIVVAPVVTLVTVLWWYWGKEREHLPVKRAVKPYEDMPTRLPSVNHAA